MEDLELHERMEPRHQQGWLFCPRLWSNAAIERRARLEIRALNALGLEVVAVTDEVVPEDAQDRWPDILALGPRIAPPPAKLAQWTAGRLLSFFGASVRLLARASWSRIDVVLSHTPMSVVAAYPWCRLHKVALVYVCHVPGLSGNEGFAQPPSSGARWPTRLISGTADRIAIRVADTVICPSEPARAWHAQARQGKNTVALPNPIDRMSFRPVPTVDKDVDLLFVGRLSVEKGPEILVNALALLDRPAHVVLIGEGKERARLEQLASGVSSTVEFVGWIPNDALPDWYRRARVVVVPSYYESQGMSAAEALACGTPVIASAVGGLVDTVKDGDNGWLVPPGDSRALAATIDEALRSGAIENLGTLDYALGEEQFSAEFTRVLNRLLPVEHEQRA